MAAKNVLVAHTDSEESSDSKDSETSLDSIDSEESNERSKLVYVRGDGDSYRGWRKELLAEEIIGKVEIKFLLCSSCVGVLRDACLFEKDGKQELRCSVCIPNNENKQIAQLNRETVNEKQVYCPLKSKGCVWSNELSELLHHLDVCELFPVACPLGCRDERGEVSRVERREVETHKTSCPMRTVNCDYCSFKVKSCEMNRHLEMCEEFPIPCPNKCSEETQWGRKKMTIHLNHECPLVEIDCPYSQYGCRVRVQRRLVEQHERENIHVHLRLTMLTIGELQSEVSDLRQENKNLKNAIIPIGELEWSIGDIENNIREEDSTYSDPFQMGLYKFKCSIKWKSEDDKYVLIYICIMKGEWDNDLTWPLRYRYTIELINQLNGEDNYVRSREVTKQSLEKFPNCFKKPTSTMNRGYGTSFISHSELLDDKYYDENEITLRIRVEQILAWQ